MAAKKTAAKPNETFTTLRAMLARHVKGLVVTKDTPEWYYLDTKQTAPNGKPLMFGAVRNGKAYTSYYLFPVYMNPKLLKGMSPALKKRMQGKSCFNFKEVDEELFAELEDLTKRSYNAFKTDGDIWFQNAVEGRKKTPSKKSPSRDR